ncbi:MAG: tetratricopeptide repeat protein [Mariniblastus sp.]|nr:tetratricopeptide repeat protein [Mariniblastus sp.]
MIPISWNGCRIGLFALFSGVLFLHAGAESGLGQTVNDEYGLAAGFYSRAQYSEAIVAFERVIQRYPQTEMAAVSHFFLAESYVQEEDYSNAYPAYQQFLTLIPGHKFSARAQFRMGEAAYRLDRVSEAATLLEAFVRAYPSDPLHEFSLPYLGQIRLVRNEPQLAQKTFERALNRFPKGSMANECRIGLADSLLAQGAVDEAVRFYEFIKTMKNNSFVGEASLALGKIWFIRNDLQKSVNNLEFAVGRLESEPKQIECKYWLARCAIESGRYKEALEVIRGIADRTMPSELNAAILFDGAITAVKLNASQTAEKWLSRLQNEWPQTRWAESALEMQIDIAYSRKDWAGALQLVKHFLNEYPESVDCLKMAEMAGRIHYQNKDYDQTIQIFQSLLANHRSGGEFENSTDPDVWNYFLGLGFVGKKEYETAFEILAKVELSSSDLDLQSALAIARGTALVGMGRTTESINHLERYLALQPFGTHAVRARADLAVAYAKESRWNDVGRVVDEMVDSHGAHEVTSTTLHFVAESALQNERWEDGEKWFRNLVKQGVSEVYTVAGLSGLFWIGLERQEQTLMDGSFPRLLNEFPGHQQTAEAAMARGAVFEANDKHLEAVQMYDFVVTHSANSELDARAQLRQAYNLQKIGGQTNLKRAKEILQLYVDEEPKQANRDEAVYMMGWVCFDLQETSESQKCFKRVIDEFPTSLFWPDSAYRVAEKNVANEEYGVAQDLLTQALKHPLTEGLKDSVLFLRGQVAAKQKDWISVGDSMEVLVSETSDLGLLAKAKYWWAESLFQQKRYKRAATLFDGLFTQKDLEAEGLQTWIRLRLAQCLSHLDDWNRVLTLCTDEWAEEGRFEAEYEFDFLIGRSHAALGRLEDARAAFANVVASEKGGTTETAAIAQWRIGETFFHQQDYKQAIAAYYRVDSLFSYERWRAAALIQAGKCQERLGNWKHAVKLYQQLIRQFPECEFRDDAELRLQAAVRQAQVSTSSTKR